MSHSKVAASPILDTQLCRYLVKPRPPAADSVQSLPSTTRPPTVLAGWLGSLVISAVDLPLDGREFDSRMWQLVLGSKTTSVCYQPPRPTQPPTLAGTGNEYRPKCGDALRLGSKGRYGSFQLWMHVWVAGKMCDPSLTHAVSERFVVSQTQ